MNATDNVLPIDAGPRLAANPARRIGAILEHEGKLNADDVRRVLQLQQAQGLRFGEAALRLHLISGEDLSRAIAKQYELPHLLPDNRRVNSELVVAYEPFHRCAEQMRALRTQLLIRWSNDRVRRRMLTLVSPGPGEGRSYVAANLAVAFAQLGERTLLIDADLRQPRQHRIFSVPNRIGLSALLSGRADRSAVVPVPEFGPLALLPSGARPPNPMELLSREELPRLLAELQPDFDVVLFDTPPATLCADAQCVGFRSGAALLLARTHHTKLEEANRVIAELADTGARTVGLVLNQF